MMTQKTILVVMVALWAAAWGASFLFYVTTEPTGDSFTRGLNRVMAFLGWQFVAAFFAGLVWIVGRQLPRTTLQRWLLRTPALLALLLVAAILGLVAYASLGIQAPETAPPRPVTAPSG